MPFFGASDLQHLLADMGVSITLGSTTVKGIVDIADDAQHDTEAGPLIGKTTKVLVVTGALPGLATEAMLVIDGRDYSVLSALQVGDGAYTQITAEEDVVTQAQFEAMQLIADRKVSRMYYDFERVATYRQITRPNGAAWALACEPPLYRPVMNVPGANRSHQVFLEDNVSDDSMGVMDFWWWLRYEFRCGVSPGMLAGGSATMRAGIQIGTPAKSSGMTAQNIDPPWSDPPKVPYVRFGVQPFLGNYFFESAAGDEVTPRFHIDLGAWATGEAPILGLLYDPLVPSVTCLKNGVALYTHTDLATLPRFGGSYVDDSTYRTGAGLFVESGSDPGGYIQGFFYRGVVTLHHDAGNVNGGSPATHWY